MASGPPPTVNPAAQPPIAAAAVADDDFVDEEDLELAETTEHDADMICLNRLSIALADAALRADPPQTSPRLMDDGFAIINLQMWNNALLSFLSDVVLRLPLADVSEQQVTNGCLFEKEAAMERDVKEWQRTSLRTRRTTVLPGVSGGAASIDLHGTEFIK